MLARGVAVACLLAAAPAARAGPDLAPFPIERLQDRVDPKAPHAFTGGGLEIVVEGTTSFGFPVPLEALELDVTSAGAVQITAAARPRSGPFTPFGPPWRHVEPPPGRSTIAIDFRLSEGWTPDAEPTLGLHGSGKLIIHAIRVRPPDRDRDRLVAGFDRARRWAPEGIGHTTINLLTPPYWSESRGIWLADVVAAAAALAAAGVLGFQLLRRRRRRPALALAAAALVATCLWGVHLLVRFLPAFDLRPTPDREERVRDHYWVAPQVGALAALARERIDPGAKVGVIGREKDWLGPEALCFNLAPRPCVFLKKDAPVHHGIQGVGSLRSEEIDTIVVTQGEWMPIGFERVAGLGRSYFIARKAP